MKKIVDRLRAGPTGFEETEATMLRAADEIEKLQKERNRPIIEGVELSCKVLRRFGQNCAHYSDSFMVNKCLGKLRYEILKLKGQVK